MTTYWEESNLAKVIVYLEDIKMRKIWEGSEGGRQDVGSLSYPLRVIIGELGHLAMLRNWKMSA